MTKLRDFPRGSIGTGLHLASNNGSEASHPATGLLISALLSARRWAAVPTKNILLLAVAMAVAITLIGLGSALERSTRSALMNSMSRTNALYLEALVAPYLQMLESDDVLSPVDRTQLQRLHDNSALSTNVGNIKVWSLGGSLLFSSDTEASSTIVDAHYFDHAKAGRVVVDTRTASHTEIMSKNGMARRFVKVYLPIHSFRTQDIIAIGEFHDYNVLLHVEMDHHFIPIWVYMIIAFVLTSISQILIIRNTRNIIMKQRSLLEKVIARSRAMLKKNNKLRRETSAARLSSIRFNETYLARVGADIHDGPIQLLGLVMMKMPNLAKRRSHAQQGGDATRLAHELDPLIREAMRELRNLSAGLILPEIEMLSAEEAINLAIDQHEHHTGTTVARDIASLPDTVSMAVRICAYRILQEALTNSHKHAGGNGQRVHISHIHGRLEITVSDAGSAQPSTIPKFEDHAKLGLKGMEVRVRSLRGALSIHSLANGGTAVKVSLPLAS